MRTKSMKPALVTPRWVCVDAKDMIVGRLAVRLANILRGKDKPTFTPHVDTGDYVIVVNADKVRMTGNKPKAHLYRRHSGYPGGLTEIPFDVMQKTYPERILESAVKGMMPKGPLGRAMFKKLKIYSGPSHPHEAQLPKTIDF